MYLVADYWAHIGPLDYISGGANAQAIPPDARDIPMTTQLNAERAAPFVLIRGDRGFLGFEKRSTGGALTLINRDLRIVCDGIADDRWHAA